MASPPLLRPICEAWTLKLAAARDAKKAFTEVARQCESFYSADMGFLWKDEYQGKFLKGNVKSRFQITIAKAFELCAVFGPTLYWRYPNRRITSYQPLDIPREIYPPDEQGEMLYQQAVGQVQRDHAVNLLRNQLMERYLNYSQREQPYGGLAGHSEMAITEALVKGRGILVCQKYEFPGSQRTLTGSFFHSVDDFFVDPDCKTPDLSDATWIAIRHVQPVWQVERRFNLPKGTLKDKAHLETANSMAEKSSASDAMYRAVGKTNDLIVWYEIWSKNGVGGRLSHTVSSLSDRFDEVVGDYAYLCVCKNCDYPLNLPLEQMMQGDEEFVRNALAWPIPTWLDDRWPVAVLDFYRKPGSAWPIAPMAPGLGELTFMNVMMSLLCNRAWSSSRDIVGYLRSAAQNVESALKSGDFQCFIEINDTAHKKLEECIQFLQSPTVNPDVFRMLEWASDSFDRRTGLTELAYGLNPGGVASRSAADIQAKQEQMSVRPDYMAGKVEDWQTALAEVEKFAARWFVTGHSVRPLLGEVGAQLWDDLITREDPEIVVREMRAMVEAGSARKPNRQRDSANLNQAIGWLLPVLQEYWGATHDPEPINAFFEKWGEAADMDMSGLFFKPPEPPPELAEQQAQMAQMEQMRANVELQLKQMDIAAKELDIEAKRTQLMGSQADQESEVAKREMDIRFDAIQKEQDLTHREEVHAIDLLAKREDAKIKLDTARKMASQKPNPTKK